MQNHVGAVVLGVVDLYQGGGGGHDDGGGHPGSLGGVGHALGVVPGGGGDQALGLLFFGQGADLEVGAADLVGPGDLHIFRLQIDLVARRLGKGGGIDQVSPVQHALQDLACRFELVKCHHIEYLLAANLSQYFNEFPR